MSSPSRATPSCGCGNMEACYYLLTFDRSQSALSAERVLRPRVPVQVIPTLRQLSVSCGISLRVEREHYPALATALRDALLSPEEYRLYYVDHTQIKEMKEG